MWMGSNGNSKMLENLECRKKTSGKNKEKDENAQRYKVNEITKKIYKTK